jgi:hypothetical protein
LSNDVSHRVPVNVPTQRQLNQVFVVFQFAWQIAWFKHGDDEHGLAKYITRKKKGSDNLENIYFYLFHIDYQHNSFDKHM